MKKAFFGSGEKFGKGKALILGKEFSIFVEGFGTGQWYE